MSVFNENSYGRFDFVGKAWLFGGISLILTVASLIYLAVAGLNYGIDFKGGTEIQVKFDQGVTIEQVRDTVTSLNLGDVGVQSFGEGNEYIIRFQGREGATDKETNEILNKDLTVIRESITKTFAASNPDIRRVDTVGPQVGAELKRNGLLAVFYCLLVILIYVALRFDYKYAPGAVLCLFHDAVITLAVFNLVGKEVNVAILAAIMTLIGFSLNDTIVVFDRIREVEGHSTDKGSKFIINRSINEMLIRTLITSGSTFVSAICLYIFADGTVEDIAFAISVGVFFGTYSSIYVAAPLVMAMEKLGAMRKSATKAARA
ncbi:preprotein translocase subunit SecF [Bdellovibrio bacteriovorus]|uniref:Protein-export membrane protein SecF n=1 Tax=Bdellovibrio bacteriovorus TaxID=959 RepID=A0A150WIT1_BDEBC|nr:protein translocase subunit SecF [Bdellovibrio bacteriovorus]KYG63659.1 preprotein translocase subunit SecF [Bdellovibrio bacteriovorus]